MKPVIVIGAGGHAKVVLSSLQRLGRAVLGLADNDPANLGCTVLGVAVMGSDDWVLGMAPDQVELALGVGLVKPRRAIWSAFTGKGYRFATIIDPTAIIGPDVAWGQAVQVLAGAVVQPCCRLDDNVLINTAAVVEHDCRIGSHAHIAPNATILGGASVGASTHVGAGAVVLQGLSVGSQAIIGAGAVVTHDVADHCTAVGNPARPLLRQDP